MARGNASSKQGTSLPRQMTRTATASNLSTSSRDGKVEDDPQILNAADDKAVMSEMFDTMDYCVMHV